MRSFFILLLISFSTATSFAATTCEQLRGKTFVSVSLLPIGETREDVVYGNWKASFEYDGSRVVLNEHDYSVVGPYTCDEEEGKFVIDKGAITGKWTGYYLPGEEVLLLEGHWYRLAK